MKQLRENMLHFLKDSSIIQFIKFGIVGVSNTVISLAVYYLIVWFNPDIYLVGSVLGAVVSIANSFYWNNKYVFCGGKTDFVATLKRLGKTYLSYGGTSLLGVILLYVEVDVMGLSRMLCPPFNRLITIPLNFLLNKYWTFRQPK